MGGTLQVRVLAGVIVAKRGTPVLLNVTNQVPNKMLIPVDPTIMASPTQTVGQLPLNRIVTHLHGGFTPWFSDGTPFQWFDPFGPCRRRYGRVLVPDVDGMHAR